uniref:Zinc finger, MYM-type 2 n=1 Tax=Neogobius melanostomus TaxID=47308 RepID=A0A8C6UH13_9GOBI
MNSDGPAGSGPLGAAVHNGDVGAHDRADLWQSQTGSVQRSQKQTGEEPSAKPSSGAPARTVKVTCANCKKPLKKGQTAYQRKGSTHLFCSTTCLSAFSHKPAPKKSCTMCKKDITNMKGTIVAQVDSSESFQEFCSTGCLSAYESKQNLPKSGAKTKCTVCGKLTEIRHEVSFKTVTHRICSDTCFNVYRRANGLIMNCCEQCGDYLPSRASANHFLLVDGQQKRFCCHNCIRDFKQVRWHPSVQQEILMHEAHSKLASCVTCKTLIKTGEVLHSIVANGTMGSYCSVTCMNKGKASTACLQSSEPQCHFCKRNALPQYQATLPEGAILSFCSSQCVTKFQDTTLQSNTNGQTAPSADSTVQLKCNYCRGAFSLRPEVLEWEEKVYQFCSKTCCDDYKKLHCIVTFCEFCQEEKTLHETVKFSGVKRPFCSEGCKLLYKQDFIRRLGLKCVSCNHCSQLCKKGVSQTLGGIVRDFCSEPCSQKFHDWYYKAARCDCCKVQGALTEAVMWRSEMKHFCDQQCLLRFYSQQNEPIMETQKGPENSSVGTEVQGAKLGNKAVLCKPLTLTKATYCKPHMQSKPLQTDDGLKREFIPIPIPVPVFVPMPMNMYTQITPAPLSLPVPLPVPVFLPTSLQGAEQILQSIHELTDKLRTAQAGSEQSHVGTCFFQTIYSRLFLSSLFIVISFLLCETGAKRQAVEGGSARSRLPLKSCYGLNAWRRWALSSANQSPDTKDSSTPGSSSGLVRRACWGLLVTLALLNQALCSFVREVCRPNGERYSPDSILYLCLGIQKHLQSKGREDDLFGDSCYQPFVEELSLVLRGWTPPVLPDGSVWGRVEEQALWSSGQLGSHSPACLLRSLVYLNTKYLGARSVEQHLQLSFTHIYTPEPVQSPTSPKHGQSRKRKLEVEPLTELLLSRVNEKERPLYELYRDKW